MHPLAILHSTSEVELHVLRGIRYEPSRQSFSNSVIPEAHAQERKTYRRIFQQHKVMFLAVCKLPRFHNVNLFSVLEKIVFKLINLRVVHLSITKLEQKRGPIGILFFIRTQP